MDTRNTSGTADDTSTNMRAASNYVFNIDANTPRIFSFRVATTQPPSPYPQGMSAYWKFEEGAGNTVHDSVNANDGTILNGAARTSGVADGGLSFDGVNDYVSVPHNSSIEFTGQGTVELWVKQNGDVGALLFKSTYVNAQGWQLYLGFPNTVIGYVNGNASWVEGAISPGQWQHVAMVFEAGTMMLYVNGVLVDTNASNPQGFKTQNVALWMGRDEIGNYFEGAVDEVAIYNRALSPTELSQHYENGLQGLGYELTAPGPPTVAVTYPNGGETVYGTVNVSANASQPGGTVASVAFSYSPDGGTTWNAIGTDTNEADGWSVPWNTTSVADGSNYRIRATATGNTSLTSTDLSDASFAVDNILWQAQLRAAGNSLSDPDNQAGVTRTSSVQYDVFDVPKPPPPEDYVRLYFPHGDWATNPGAYSRDMRPAADSITWDFEVLTSFSGNVTLTWDVSQIPASYGLAMLRDTRNTADASDDTVMDLRSATQYVYASSADTPREFRFTVNTTVFVGTTLAAGWNLVSLPLAVDPETWPAQLGDDIPQGLFLYWYDPVAGGYQMWASDLPAFNPAPGKGYWIKVPAETTVDIEGYPAANADFVIHLLPGWNMIGDPFSFAVDWEKASVSYNGSTVSIVDSHANNWVLKYLYRYDTSASGYRYDTAPDGVLTPWMGYWVKSLVEADLIIPPVPMP